MGEFHGDLTELVALDFAVDLGNPQVRMLIREIAKRRELVGHLCSASRATGESSAGREAASEDTAMSRSLEAAARAAYKAILNKSWSTDRELADLVAYAAVSAYLRAEAGRVPRSDIAAEYPRALDQLADEVEASTPTTPVSEWQPIETGEPWMIHALPPSTGDHVVRSFTAEDGIGLLWWSQDEHRWTHWRIIERPTAPRLTEERN